MKLSRLLKDVGYKNHSPRILAGEITGIATDHRKVKRGDVFIALKGENFDGNDYVTDAIINGASAVVSEVRHNLPECIQVDDARKAYALISKHFYEDVCDKLKIVAVTGTNGKTTVCNTVADILRRSGKRVGVIGTLGANIDGQVFDTGMTTPDPDKLHEIFKKMYDDGKEYVVMEASAHALALKKLEGITFEVGVLTNITEDHLDFFGDMETYAKAKFKLFDKNRVKKAVICKGKVFDEKLLESVKVPYVTYGLEESGDKKHLSAEVLKKDFCGSYFFAKFKGREYIVKTPLVGLYNIENVLASIGVCDWLGLTMEDIVKGISITMPVEGRFNVVHVKGLNIIIDFAHTPDGLENVLSTTRELATDLLVVIFGCGGNRDKLKRPIMGEIASRIADEVILTSDNPRYEKPMSIINEIRKGITSGKVKAIADRRGAIEYALEKYPPGTTIVIAGKGGEQYQDIGGIKYPYNDLDVVKNFIIKRYKMNQPVKESEPPVVKQDDLQQDSDRVYGDIEL